MPYMRVKPIGAGTTLDPLRAPLPTYQLVHDFGAQGWIIQVRDEDVPEGAPAPIKVNVPDLGAIDVIVNVPPAVMATWRAKLDARYPRRDRSSDPNVA